MQWILHDDKDSRSLGGALDTLGIPFSVHKVVPFVGELVPEPPIAKPDAVILFGFYTLWRYAKKHGLSPGVFRIAPFLHQTVWHPHLLNGPEAQVITLQDVPEALPLDDTDWFMRPVDDSKSEPGRVRTARDIHALAKQVLSLDVEDLPEGSLRHDTELMFTAPVNIQTEWRVWVADNRVVTYSLYKEGSNVTYRNEIDEDALAFTREMIRLNPDYAKAYVMDVCRSSEGMKLLETNCINAAGFYAADLVALVRALEDWHATQGR